MIKIVHVFVGLMLALSFAGCGAESEPDVLVPDSNSSSTVSDEVFADFIRENTDEFDGAPDADIAELGAAVCDLWDAGGDFNDVFDAILSSGVDATDGGFIVGAGTAAYCPEYNYKVS